MSIKKIIKCKTYPCIKKVIDLLILSRSKDTDQVLNIGINYTIILNSVCYLEGVLESGLKEILIQRKQIYRKVGIPDLYTRKTVNTLINSLEQELENRIARTTGISNYDEIFYLLSNKHFIEYERIKPLLEGIQVLFQFRNVLAHGREISTYLLSAYWIEEPWKEFYFGGYKKVEDYLIKRKLIDKKFCDCDSIDIYFSDKVADHFWNLTKQFISELCASLDEDIKKSFNSVIDEE